MNTKYHDAILSLRNIANFGGSSEEVDDATDTLEELVNKYERMVTPRLMRCTCGHNRRSREFSWLNNSFVVRMTCNNCGRKIEGSSERDVTLKWNEVINSEKEERK